MTQEPQLSHKKAKKNAKNLLLIEAIRKAKIDRVEQLIEAKADSNYRTPGGLSLLMLAACKPQQLPILKLLLASNADPTLHGGGALSEAMDHGNVPAVKALLAANANVNETNESGQSVLITAIGLGQSVLVKELLEAKADIQQKSIHGSTALLTAIAEGDLATTKLLLQAKADVDDTDESLNSPLYFLAFSHQPSSSAIAEELIKAGNVHTLNHQNSDGATPLMAAAQQGLLDLVTILMEAGADFEATNLQGDSVLDVAKKNEHSAIVNYITTFASKSSLEIARQLVSTPSDAKKKPQMPLSLAANLGNVDWVDTLLKAGAAVSEGDTEGNTPLMLAAKKGHFSVIDSLLLANAENTIHKKASAEDAPAGQSTAAVKFMQFDERKKTSTKFIWQPVGAAKPLIESKNSPELSLATPVTLSAASSPFTAPEPLALVAADSAPSLETGADKNYRDQKGNTALICAVISGNLAAVEKLLTDTQNGVDAVNNNHDSSLMFAAKHGNQLIVRALLQAKATVTLRNRQGFSAGDIARLHQNFEIASLLENGLTAPRMTLPLVTQSTPDSVVQPLSTRTMYKMPLSFFTAPRPGFQQIPVRPVVPRPHAELIARSGLFNARAQAPLIMIPVQPVLTIQVAPLPLVYIVPR